MGITTLRKDDLIKNMEDLPDASLAYFLKKIKDGDFDTPPRRENFFEARVKFLEEMLAQFKDQIEGERI